jgi:uncharacterized membrane protein
LFRLAAAALVSAAVYFGAYFWVLRAWNAEDSLVVEILDIGKETAPSQERSDEPFQSVKVALAIRVLTGNRAGEAFSITATQMVGAGSGVELRKGRRYVLVADVFDDGSAQYSIADSFRAPSVAGVIVFASACLTVFAGWAGVRALTGLSLSIACLLWGYVPLAAQGFPPVPLAFLAAFFIAAATVFCVVHRKESRVVALGGSLGGVAGAYLLARLMTVFWQLSGLAGDSASLLATTLPNTDMRGVLLAAVVIASLGAVLDVGISITASMSELVEYDPDIPLPRLWSAGFRVGSEVLGSMINTLILAYIGSSLPISILISNAGADFWGLMNDPYVGQEVVHSLAGTLGLLLTIPATTSLFTLREKAVREKAPVTVR